MTNKKILLYFIPALIVTLIIFTLSSRDIETSNAESGQVTQTIANLFGSSSDEAADGQTPTMPLDILNLYIRSLAHVIEFGGLGLMIILGCLLAKLSQRHLIIVTLTWGAVVALSDELVQYFTPGRTCDILDMTKDVIGIVLALAFAYVVKKIYVTMQQRKSIAIAK